MKFLMLFLILSMSSCSDNPVSAQRSGKINSSSDFEWIFNKDVSDTTQSREGEKLKIDIVHTNFSDKFTEEEISWIKSIAFLWGQAIYSEPDYEVVPTYINGSIRRTRIAFEGGYEEIQEGEIIQGIRLYIAKKDDPEKMYPAFSSSYDKKEGLIPYVAVLFINSAFIKTEWEYSAATSHQIGHILGIGEQEKDWSDGCNHPSLWMSRIADGGGNYLYENCLPRESEIDRIVMEKEDDMGLFFSGENVKEELLRLFGFPFTVGAKVESLHQEGSYLRTAQHTHPHFDGEFFAHDIMSAYGPLFYNLGDFPATSLTIAALKDMGLNVDPTFARDTQVLVDPNERR